MFDRNLALSRLSGATIAITGGTGSFGRTLAKYLLSDSDINLKIISRDERKQDSLRRELNTSRCKFVISDVRDANSINSALQGVDFVFHAAALKQVPSCEFFPIEAVKTNILGTQNVIDACAVNNVKNLVCLSTDKAVYPINAMGISKAMMEKVVKAAAQNSSSTLISITRYGNVMGSRGSVIPLFWEQINSGQELTITDGRMTRFLMNLDDSVDLVLKAFVDAEPGDTFIQKAPSCTIMQLAQSIAFIAGKPVQMKEIGIRHGEKMYEALLSKEEAIQARDDGSWYIVPADTRDLNYEHYFQQGQKDARQASEYNSDNAEKLSGNVLIERLKAVIQAGFHD